jgi:DNA-binding Lrp family transcriptional regulator
MPLRVDELDMRILREVFTGEGDYLRAERVSADAVARAVGVHRKTVAARLKKMTDARFYLPARLDIEPSLFGLVGGKFFLDVPPEMRSAATREAIFHIEGTNGILGYADGWDVMMYAEDERSLASRVELAKHIARASRATWNVHSARDYPPPPKVKLTRLDLRLVAALMRDARAPFPRLAKALGVTARTLERRFERLRDEGAVFMLPGGDGDATGVVFAYVSVGVPREARARDRAVGELLKLLPNHILRNLATLGRAHVFLYGRSLADLEAQAQLARKVPGVDDVEFHVMTGAWTNDAYADWVARVLERRA